MIIETKLYVPKTKDVLVQRPHLYERLDKGLNNKLTLIIAPAGYGKSTLLSEWSSMLGAQVAWVSLDWDDNNPVRFWMHTIESLRRVSSSFHEKFSLHYLEEDASGNTHIAMLINHLNRLSEQIILIWDDFHIIEGSSILNGVYYLLERLPTHVHIFIASRNKLPISLSRLRVEGSLNELGMDDLRFDNDELERFFSQCTDLSLNLEELTAIQTKTEGWVAGIRLAALSMDSRMDQTEWMRAVLMGRHRNVTDYFFDEVLVRQSEEMQQFLLYTSILKQINAELCEAMTKLPNGTKILQQIQEANLFLISLDHERKWFRYHHLFQDFLRMELELREPEQVKYLHINAGRWLERNGFLKEALEHYLSGESFESALHLLKILIPSLPSYEWINLHQWLNEIPDNLLFKKPGFFLTNLASLFLSGHIDEATKKYWWAVNELEQDSNPLFSEEEIELMEAGLDFLVAFRSFLEKDFNSFILYSQKYLERDPSGGLLIGFGSEQDGYHPTWNIYLSRENLGKAKAEEILLHLLDMWSKTKNKPFYAHLCIDYAELLYERNRLEEAEQYAYQTLTIGKEYNNDSLTVKASLMLAQIDEVCSRSGMADLRIKQLFAEIDLKKAPVLGQEIELFQVQLYLRREKKKVLSKWIDEKRLYVSDQISASMLREYYLLARIVVEEGKVVEAMDLTNRLLYIAEEEGKNQNVILFTIYKSLLLAQQNQMTASYKVLEEALLLASSYGYIRTFLDEGESLKKLLTQYVYSTQNHHDNRSKNIELQQAKQLLELMALEKGLDEASVIELQENLLTEKESIVLAHIKRGLSNRGIAEKLDISLSTVKTHINNLYRKLGVNNRVLALQKAQELKLL